MDNLSWIMSEGGPLIAMESRLQASWGGVFRLTIAQSEAENDYDRPPKKLDYIQEINLQEGKALIFGDGPLDTAFWRSEAGINYIIRVVYCEPEFDGEECLRNIDQGIFDNACEMMEFSFQTDNIILFDSADDGNHREKESVATKIQGGHYVILTCTYEPDEKTFLVIHKFDRLA